MKDYFFPPQLGVVKIHFGYKTWEWFMIGGGVMIASFAVIITLNILFILPLMVYMIISFRPSNHQSNLSILIKAYNYFVKHPITYEYEEVQDV